MSKEFAEQWAEEYLNSAEGKEALEEQILKEHLRYIKSDEAREKSKKSLLEQMLQFMRHKYKDANIELLNYDTFEISGSDEDKLAIIKELREFGIL